MLLLRFRLFIFFVAKKTNQKKTLPWISSMKSNGRITPIHGLRFEWS